MTPEEARKARKKSDGRVTQTLLALLGVLIAVSFNFWYTAHVNEQNDKRWCSLMVNLDNRYQALPPGNIDPAAKEFADNIHDLRKDFHCMSTPIFVTTPSPSPNPPASGR